MFVNYFYILLCLCKGVTTRVTHMTNVTPFFRYNSPIPIFAFQNGQVIKLPLQILQSKTFQDMGLPHSQMTETLQPGPSPHTLLLIPSSRSATKKGDLFDHDPVTPKFSDILTLFQSGGGGRLCLPHKHVHS